MKTIPAFLLGLFLLAGCTGQPSPDPVPSPETSPSETRSGRPGVELSAIVEAGRTGTVQELLGRLNPPLRITEEPIENRHVAGQIDTLRTYRYDGLRFTVYDITDSPKTLLRDLTVTDSTYQAPLGGRVGMMQQEVEATLGMPDEKQDNQWIYRLDPQPTPGPTLHVRFDGSTVRALEWSFYID